MIRIGTAIAATALIFATAAFAQKGPPQGQGVCAMGYAKASKSGAMEKISKEGMKMADKNGDGKLSKTEFSNACAKRLFKEQESRS